MTSNVWDNKTKYIKCDNYLLVQDEKRDKRIKKNYIE